MFIDLEDKASTENLSLYLEIIAWLSSLLKIRGIFDDGICPMCNYEEESASHLLDKLNTCEKFMWHLTENMNEVATDVM